MALLTYFDARNRIDDELPKTVVAEGVMQLSGSPVLTRTTQTTQRFRYVGMDRATAEVCQLAMIAKYTPPQASPYASGSLDVRATPMGGSSMWQVEVAVSSTVLCIVEILEET